MTIDLRLPSSNKIGWPWSVENSTDSNSTPIDLEYPKITVVTPNYNYGHYLEETIRSVLLQGYPNLEYIIIDGGSTDNSVEIIKKYEPWIAYWESQPDRGQTHAINKGLERTTGEVFNWINSDDILAPGSLFAIAQGIKNYDGFAGVVNNFDDKGNKTRVIPQNLNAKGLLTRLNTSDKPAKLDSVYHQPGFWFKTEALKTIGVFNEHLHIRFDFDMMIKYLHKYPKVNYTQRILTNFRCHEESKTSTSMKIEKDSKYIAKSILNNSDFQDLHQSADLYLKRLNWYENIADTINKSENNQFITALKILVLSSKNPKAYWTKYTFGSIRQLIMSQV